MLFKNDMARMRTLLIGASLLLSAALPEPAYANMRAFSMLELAEQSDTIFAGKVTILGNDSAIAEVSEVLCGNVAKSVTLIPIQIQHCIGRSTNFAVGEHVLIFGKKADEDRVVVTAGGQGKITLNPKSRETELIAAKRIIEIVPMQEDNKNKALLTEIRSQNQRLRLESRQHIVSRISYSELRNHYKADFMSLIGDDDPEIQLTGLQGIRFVEAKDAIPRIVELTRSGDLRVVSAASLALGRYDTPESTAAIIALTKHDNPQVRIRACIDLDNSRRPEAKEALKRLLDDRDPMVRATGPRGLVYWLRRNEADDVLPKLVAMLNDENSDVRSSAADKLGECRNSEMIPPLLAALRKNPLDENMKQSIFRSLYCHYSKGDTRAKEVIDNDIQVVVAALKNGGPNDAFGAPFHAVGILALSTRSEARESLQWGAESHPNGEVRSYAKRCLSK